MSLIGFLELGSLISYIIILFLLLSRWKNSFSYVIKRILLILIILFIFHSLSNTLEWFYITDALDPYEDYIQILEPILWFFFFAIYIQEMAEKNRRESERKYHHLFESSPYFIGLIDIKGVLIDCNDVSNEILSTHTKGDIIGKNITEIFSLNERNKYLIPIFEKFIKNIFKIAGTNQEPFDFQLYRSIGGYLWLHVEGTLIEIEKQKLIQFIMLDITERKQAEMELQLERDNLINILSSMEDGVYIVDKNYDIEYVNPILIQEFGQYEGKKCYNYFHDRNESCPWCKNQEVFEGKTVRWEWHSFKNQKTYDLIDTPLKNVDGSVSKLEIFHDITERKEVADKLYKINRAYQMLSECNLLLVNAKNESELFDKLCQIVVDVGGYRLAWIGLADNNEQKTVSPIAQAGFENGYLESLNITWSDTESGRGPTGTAIRTSKPCIAKNILTDPSFKPWREQAIKRGYISSIALPLIIDNVAIGSLNIYSAEKKAFDIEEDDVLIKLSNNLTFGIEKLRSYVKRRQVEQELKESEKKYRGAYNRAEFYKDIFSHDINNILQSILSGIQINQLILNNPEKLDNLKINAKIIKEQVIRGSKLVSNVRKLSQLEEAKRNLEKTEILNVLKRIISIVKKSFEDKNLAIRVDSVDENLFVKANDFLEDVFENLLINAVRHNNSLLIEITVRILKEQQNGINYVKIEFMDNGFGVADSMKERIFKRAYGKEEIFFGMGLGLSLVRRIIETYNGKIWVEDRVKGDRSKGSNFVLLIPEGD